MMSSGSVINEELMQDTQSDKVKPRRRLLRPMPTNSIQYARRKFSPLANHILNNILKKIVFCFCFCLAGIRSSGAHANMRYRTIGIHYQGDTAVYHGGHHQQQDRYDGNGRIRHPGGIYFDWKASPWANDHLMERFFTIQQGIVTIKEQGLYYIYAQVEEVKPKKISHFDKSNTKNTFLCFADILR